MKNEPLEPKPPPWLENTVWIWRHGKHYWKYILVFVVAFIICITLWSYARTRLFSVEDNGPLSPKTDQVEIDAAKESKDKVGQLTQPQKYLRKAEPTARSPEIHPPKPKAKKNTKPAPCPSRIRPSVSSMAEALRDQTGSSRVGTVKAMLARLPKDLNAKEISLLAGHALGSHRIDVLQLLVKNTQQKSLHPGEIAQILKNETGSSRGLCVLIISYYIKPPLTGAQAVGILGNETGSSRVNIIKHIAPLLRRPLSDSEVRNILKGTSGSSRTVATWYLFGK